MKAQRMILGGMLAAAMCAATGCSVATRLERQRASAHLSQLTRAERQAQRQDYRPQVVRLQRDSNTFFLAPVDTLPDGERVMSLQIEQVTVMAKVRSVPERNGRVHLDFVVTLPKQLLGSSRSVVITPLLHKPEGTVPLEDLVIRGGRFSLLQERDYWQYETYVRRFTGREPQHNHLLLLAGGPDGRDFEEDAYHAHGEGAGRGRQRLPAAALGYVGLPRLVDALLCRHAATLPHPCD